MDFIPIERKNELLGSQKQEYEFIVSASVTIFYPPTRSYESQKDL